MGMRMSSIRTAGWIALLLAPILLAGLRSARAEEPADIERRKEDLLLKLRTTRAIDRGAIWVAGQQKPDGSFHLKGNKQSGPFPVSRHRFGESALGTLTLAHCGYDVERVEIKRATSYFKKHYRSYLKGDYWPQASSYSLSLVVLALHELYAKDPDSMSDEDRERYGDSLKNSKNPCQYPRWARQMIWKILDWMLKNRAKEGLFRYPDGLPDSGPPGGGPPPGAPPGMPMPGAAHNGPEDLSNSQYVLLALWAGTRCGYEIDQKTLEHIANRLLAIQDRSGPRVRRMPDPLSEAERGGARYGDGTRTTDAHDRARGFGYTPGGRATGSMTTAGLSSLVIVKAMLLEQHTLDPELRKRLDQGVWDSIAWLARNYDVDGNPPERSPVWHYYYLYGLERACVIAGKKYLGERDWYRDGSILLVDAQQKDGRWQPPSAVGAWSGGPGPVYDTAYLDTCFALLFLKRATVLPKVPLLPQPVVTPSEPESPKGP